MVFWLILLFLVVLPVTALLTSVWWTLWCFTPLALRSPHGKCGPLKVCVVLGSGGHTSEMARVIRAIPRSYWTNNRPFYIVSETDKHSVAVAHEQEKRLFGRNAVVYAIPRAREVGQSYQSSIASTLRAIMKAVEVVWQEEPDVVLTNGPGVCVPVVAAAVLFGAVAPWRMTRPAIVYMESFTCVQRPSLTGRLLTPYLVDIVTGHWKSLMPSLCRMRLTRPLSDRRRGRGIFYIGTEGMTVDDVRCGIDDDDDDEDTTKPLRKPLSKDKYALVTVGSTCFDQLIHAMATEEVCCTLKERFGITSLLLQYGTTDFNLTIGSLGREKRCKGSGTGLASQQQRLHQHQGGEEGGVQRRLCAGVTIEAFRYRPHLSQWVEQASLVVTHAGAGTILECLTARVPTIVVPNRSLMSDHQLELAEALAAEGNLFYLAVESLARSLGSVDVGTLRPFAGINVAAVRFVLSLPLTGKRFVPTRELNRGGTSASLS